MVEVLYYAIPFFVLLLVVEALSFRHYHEDDLVGYELNDTRTSITMGLGNVTVNVVWKLVVVVIYAALYELTPFRLPEDAWWVWILLFLADDLAYYWFHRVSHVSRFFWASHVVHHSSTHFNLSTALRQTWVPMTYLPFWLPLLLVGFPPWMVLLAQSWSLIYQFGMHTERIGRLPRPLEFVLQHAVAPSRPPRRQRAVPGPQLRRHPDRLGPAVRLLHPGVRARPLRADQEHRHVQPGQGRVRRVRVAAARPARRPRLADPAADRAARPRVATRRRARVAVQRAKSAGSMSPRRSAWIIVSTSIAIALASIFSSARVRMSSRRSSSRSKRAATAFVTVASRQVSQAPQRISIHQCVSPTGSQSTGFTKSVPHSAQVSRWTSGSGRSWVILSRVSARENIGWSK